MFPLLELWQPSLESWASFMWTRQIRLLMFRGESQHLPFHGILSVVHSSLPWGWGPSLYHPSITLVPKKETPPPSSAAPSHPGLTPPREPWWIWSARVWQSLGEQCTFVYFLHWEVEIGQGLLNNCIKPYTSFEPLKSFQDGWNAALVSPGNIIK